jgi:hypothetical protein
MQIHLGKIHNPIHNPTWNPGNSSIWRRSLCMYATAAALLSAAAFSSSADTLLFDDSARANFTSSRVAADSPLAAITVSSLTSISQIGAQVDLSANGNMKFLIFNLNTGTLLFSTASAPYVDTGLDFKVSSSFSPFALNPGIVYGIGAISDVSGLWSTENSSSGNNFTQNGITASDDRNGNVSNFTTPVLGTDGAAMIIVQLYGPVPEPATFTLCALGGIVLLGSRKRQRH